MHKYTHVCFLQSGTQSKHSRLDMEAQVFVVVLLPSSYTLEIPSLPQVSFFFRPLFQIAQAPLGHASSVL